MISLQFAIDAIHSSTGLNPQTKDDCLTIIGTMDCHFFYTKTTDEEMTTIVEWYKDNAPHLQKRASICSS